SGGRYRQSDRERHFRLSPDHYCDERRRGNRHCGGHVAYWRGRSCLVGNGSFFAEFRADPRADAGRLLAGALAAENVWLMLLPAGLYLGIHLIEGETFTPMLLARRFTLNPVLVIVSLVFWFWMWG